jgi:hypothetical protein
MYYCTSDKNDKINYFIQFSNSYCTIPAPSSHSINLNFFLEPLTLIEIVLIIIIM